MKVWTDDNKTSETKKPAVALRGKFLIAVDPYSGEAITVLFDFIRMEALAFAMQRLIEDGYDPSFARWDELAYSMIELLEDFE